MKPAAPFLTMTADQQTVIVVDCAARGETYRLLPANALHLQCMKFSETSPALPSKDSQEIEAEWQ